LIGLLGACAPAVPSPTPVPAAPSSTPRPSTPTSAPAATDTSVPASPTPEPTVPIRLCSPLAALSLQEIPQFITQPFSMPGPIHEAGHPDWVQRDDSHHGVDIGYYKRDGKLFTGTPTQAALDGRIAAVVHDRPPYGNMVIVETPFAGIPAALVAGQAITPGDSLYTLYAHLQNLQALAPGQAVTCGQQLAETGLTGFTGGPHLHFETRWGPPAQRFASMAYYIANATPEEMVAYEEWRMSAVFHLFDPMKLLGEGQ
jgi:murein DD-endopeptidase MepM/ murein hydrolase activator NlpD